MVEAALLILAVAPAQAIEKPEAPLSVYVFTPPAPGAEEQAKAAVKTIQDQVKRRKDWFRVVDGDAEADILVEVLSQGVGQGASRSSMGAPATTHLNPDHTGGDLGVRESSLSVEDVANSTASVPKGHHFFETEVTFRTMGVKRSMLGTASANRKPSSAAAELAKQIETFCKENYVALRK